MMMFIVSMKTDDDDNPNWGLDMSLLRVLGTKDTNMQVGDPVSNVVIFQDFNSTNQGLPFVDSWGGVRVCVDAVLGKLLF